MSWIVLLAFLLEFKASANTSQVESRSIEVQKKPLIDSLSEIRSRVSSLEQSLVDSIHSQKNAKSQIKKIQILLKLRRQEQALGKQRLTSLEKTVSELEVRRVELKDKLTLQQKLIRKFLMAIEASRQADVLAQLRTFQVPEQEKVAAPRRKVLARLVERGLKEIEVLRADLADAAQLEARIQDEKEQLAFLFQSLKEEEGVLELNRQIQVELMKRKKNERLTQLESYRKLKTAESQVEHLIKQFNARKELEHAVETERKVSKAMLLGEFSQLKGKLPFPVLKGKIASQFGRVFDSKTGLYVFKKGIDISTGKNEPVLSISTGRVAFSGELPTYGRVVIIDHGNHYYSLFAHLGEILKKSKDQVLAGDVVGRTDDINTPLYFEIRARNVAVNPLQWIYN